MPDAFHACLAAKPSTLIQHKRHLIIGSECEAPGAASGEVPDPSNPEQLVNVVQCELPLVIGDLMQFVVART